MRSPRPDMADDLTDRQQDLTQGKYEQILWGINEKNMRPEQFLANEPQKEIQRISDIVSGQDAYKQSNTTDTSMYDSMRFPTHESFRRTKELIRLICEIKDPYDSVMRIYPNGEGSDPGDNIPKWSVEHIKLSNTIPNEPFKDLDYMDSSNNAQSMIDSVKGGDKLPPILVIRHPYAPEKFLVVDGNHRRYAYKIAGEEKIPAYIINPEDVLLMSKPWGSEDNKGMRLSDVNDDDIINMYFVKPDGTNEFRRSNNEFN
jgi:hypothetical protein